MHSKFEADFRILCVREEKGEKRREEGSGEGCQLDAIQAGKMQ